MATEFASVLLTTSNGRWEILGGIDPYDIKLSAAGCHTVDELLSNAQLHGWLLEDDAVIGSLRTLTFARPTSQ